MSETHDLGYFKRVDQGDGTSKIVDWSGKVVATVQTELVAPHCHDLEVRRFRMTETSAE